MEQNKEALRSILQEIERNTRIPVIRLLPDSGMVTLTGSKIGGLPYLPHNGAAPVDKNGMQMKMLAQVHFAEAAVPEPFPSMGLLQFWIMADDREDDGMYGMNFDDQTDQSMFRVIYYPQVEEDVLPEEVEQKLEVFSQEVLDFFPVKGATAVRLSIEEEGLTMQDGMQFEEIFAAYQKRYAPDAEPIEAYDLYDIFSDEEMEALTHPDGCKLGGYPAFTQEDPREGIYDGYDTLLFQMDSMYKAEGVEIMFGDCGICNFFIPLAKLRQCQFDDIVYNWDCY